MTLIEKQIEVNVPVANAYDQWTQFESFPQFMEGIKKVQQEDDEHLRWVADVGGVEREWRAEITEQVPHEKVAWRSIEGARHRGQVRLVELAADRTLVTLAMEYHPDGIIEGLGAAVGGVGPRIQGDLQNFKELVEGRSAPDGGTPSEVPGGTTTTPTSGEAPEGGKRPKGPEPPDNAP